MSSAPAQPELPRRVGDFSVLGVLGEGGSGIVYDARWGHREVALKVLRPSLVATPKEREQFLYEARLLAEIQHPAVVKVLGVGEGADGRPYLAMEKLRGESLAARLGRGRLELRTALELFAQLSDAVSALHARGLVHRDLKPENIVLVAGVDGRDHAVLLDFGIAKDLAAPASTTTQDGGVRGTPAYMAPERFFGQPASIATDVYELAVVLYAMIAGRLPWDDSADPDVRLNPRGLTEHAPDVPSALDVAVRRALSTRAANRPQSAHELGALVMAAAGALAPSPRTTDAVRPAPRPRDESGPIDVRAVTVDMRGGQLDTGSASLVPASTGAQPRHTGKIVALAAAGVAVVVGVGVAAKLLSDPGDGLPAAKAPPATAEAPAPAPAPAPATDVAPKAMLSEQPAPAAPEQPLVSLDVLRPQMAHAVELLPDDTMFAVGVLLAELRIDAQLDGLIDIAGQTPAAQMMLLETGLSECKLDLRAVLDWAVMSGPAEESAVDMIASGRWTRAEADECLRASVGGDAVEVDGAISRITGKKPRTIGWIDDRTFYISSRAEADAAWMTTRMADAGAPSGPLADMLGEVDVSSTFWFAGDERERKTGLGSDDMVAMWGHAKGGTGSVTAEMRIRYKDKKTANAAQQELQTQVSGLDLNGLGTLLVTLDEPTVLHVQISLPRMIVGLLVDGLGQRGL